MTNDRALERLLAYAFFQLFLVAAALVLAWYGFFYLDHLHFHVAHGYARLGYPAAQHVVGQRYSSGLGVDQDHDMAMKWFKSVFFICLLT